MDIYFVYIVECSDLSLYTGITKDVTRRIIEHNTTPKGARYTKMRLPVILKYFERVGTRGDALKREYQIKQLSREQKISLIHTSHL